MREEEEEYACSGALRRVGLGESEKETDEVIGACDSRSSTLYIADDRCIAC